MAVFEVRNEITEPVPDWDAGETIVNVLRIAYLRYWARAPVVAGSVDGIQGRPVVYEFVDPVSRDRHGERLVDMDASAFSAPADSLERPILGQQNEGGHGLAQDRRLHVFDRFRRGAQTIQVPVMRSLHIHVPERIQHYSAVLRAGDWVRMDLSWFPDYATRRRRMQSTGQIVAINDVDCAWRVLLIEEVLPTEGAS